MLEQDGRPIRKQLPLGGGEVIRVGRLTGGMDVGGRGGDWRAALKAKFEGRETDEDWTVTSSGLKPVASVT